MERITLYLRTQKTKGIKLRFRLTDGREIQLFHKSEIIADLSDLSRFTDDCQLKPRTTVYNPEDRGQSLSSGERIPRYHFPNSSACEPTRSTYMASLSIQISKKSLPTWHSMQSL